MGSPCCLHFAHSHRRFWTLHPSSHRHNEPSHSPCAVGSAASPGIRRPWWGRGRFCRWSNPGQSYWSHPAGRKIRKKPMWIPKEAKSWFVELLQTTWHITHRTCGCVSPEAVPSPQTHLVALATSPSEQTVSYCHSRTHHPLALRITYL